MTAEERKAFQEAGAQAAAEANRKRPPDARRAIARRAAMTRRMWPSWMRPAEVRDSPGSPGEPPAPEPAAIDDLAQLGRAIEELTDEELERIAAALTGRLA